MRIGAGVHALLVPGGLSQAAWHGHARLLPSAFFACPIHHKLIQAPLRFTCHCTEKRRQNTLAPLYRLRWALSRLWDDDRSRLTCFLPLSSDPLSACSFVRDLELFSEKLDTLGERSSRAEIEPAFSIMASVQNGTF